jgi:hypothetical protein
MKKINFLSPLFLTLLCLANPGLPSARAQDCPQYPAVCPGDTDAIRDEEKCRHAFIIHKEFELQNSLRSTATAELERIADLKKWTFYVHEEWSDGESNLILKENDPLKPLDETHRGPHPFYISFIVIVNDDSLHAWRNWLHSELTDKSNALVKNLKDAESALENDPVIKSYSDSMNYYMQRQTEYISSHSSVYQAALMKQDEAAIGQYESGLKKISDKTNYFIDKQNARREQIMSPSYAKDENLQALRNRQTILFRNASLIRVTFQFNPIVTTPCGSDIELIKTLRIPDSYYGCMVHQTTPVNDKFLSSFTWATDDALVLMGPWKKKEGTYYQSIFEYNAHERDKATVKKIPFDKIQTMAVHVEGRPDYLDEFIKQLDWRKFSGLIYHP